MTFVGDIPMIVLKGEGDNVTLPKPRGRPPPSFTKLIDSRSKYVRNFDVYCGASHLMEGQLIVNKGKPKQ